MAKLKTRKAQLAYLQEHARHYTINTRTSYAVPCSISDITFPNRETALRAYDFLYSETIASREALEEVSLITEDFDERHNYNWQIGIETFGTGHFLLYRSGRRPTNHKSYCPKCHQRNFTRFISFSSAIESELPEVEHLTSRLLRTPNWTPTVMLRQLDAEGARPAGWTDEQVMEHLARMKRDYGYSHGRFETSTKGCGRCSHPTRINHVFHEIYVEYTGVDDDADFDEWSTVRLRERYELILDFDQTCKEAKQAFANFVASHRTEEVLVPCTRREIIAVAA